MLASHYEQYNYYVKGGHFQAAGLPEPAQEQKNCGMLWWYYGILQRLENCALAF